MPARMIVDGKPMEAKSTVCTSSMGDTLWEVVSLGFAPEAIPLTARAQYPG